MRPFQYAALALVLSPAFAIAQTTVYTNDFSSSLTRGSLRTSGTTYNVGDWTIASTKASTGSAGTGSPSLSGSGLAFGISTSSGFIETQNRFTSSAITLGSTNDFIQLKVVFTDNNNVLAGNSGTSSSLAIGLFDTSGNNPAIGLQSSGLNTTASSSFATGNAALWEGYIGRIAPTGGSNKLDTRPLQSGAGTTSANQELLFNNAGGGAFNNPTGTNISSATSTLALLTNGQNYIATFRITRSGETTYLVDYNLRDSNSTVIQSSTGTASASNFINSLSVDGLAFGYRFNGTSQVSGLTMTNVEVTSLIASAIPEPSTSAALAGLAGLAVLGLRRKRKA